MNIKTVEWKKSFLVFTQNISKTFLPYNLQLFNFVTLVLLILDIFLPSHRFSCKISASNQTNAQCRSKNWAAEGFHNIMSISKVYSIHNTNTNLLPSWLMNFYDLHRDLSDYWIAYWYILHHLWGLWAKDRNLIKSYN